jgi:endonuclease/exonuclease/phosphatase (EEP) superfamily protein YafD
MRKWLRVARTWRGAVLAVFLLVFYCFIGDRIMIGEWLTIWPPVLWGGLLALRSVMLLFEKARKAALVTASLGLVLTLTHTELGSLFRHDNPSARARFDALRVSQAASGPSTLRIVSWNVSGGAPLHAIEALNADVCFFQEIGDVPGAAATSPHWRLFAWQASHDPGTLSRFPLTSLKTQRAGPWQEPLLAETVLPRGQRILLVNVRLALPSLVSTLASLASLSRPDYGYRERVEQFPRLAQLIATTQRERGLRSVILAGDFNAPADAASADPLRRALRDVWPVAGTGWGGTMTAPVPLSRIDQCWVSADIEVVSARVIRARESDHRFLVVDLIVP